MYYIDNNIIISLNIDYNLHINYYLYIIFNDNIYFYTKLDASLEYSGISIK